MWVQPLTVSSGSTSGFTVVSLGTLYFPSHPWLKQMWVLSSHHAQCWAPVNSLCWATPHWLGWTHLRTAMTLKCLLPCSPFLPILLSQSHCTRRQVLAFFRSLLETPKDLTPACQPAFLEGPELTQVGI